MSSFGARAVIGAVVAVIGSYYWWQMRAIDGALDWVNPQSGYYNFLARAFAHGQVALPIQPSQQLMEAENPWDPHLPDVYKIHDMSYYQGHYYLYHGAGPAVLLFTPWLMLTGHDMPERFAVFLMCFGGFLFCCAVLLRWLAIAGLKLGPAMVGLLLFATGMCSCIPYLLNRVLVYEVAISGGYFFIAGALFFVTIGIESLEKRRSLYWMALAGLFFGAAVSCRPHLGAAGVLALVGLAAFYRERWSRLAAFASTFALIGLLVAVYNYERFGNPMEFGVTYLLAAPNQDRIRLASANLIPGLYFWLACPPSFSAVFPWVQLVYRYPFNNTGHPFPPEYFMEATCGAWYLAPFVFAALFVSFERRTILLWTTAAASVLVLIFLAFTGFTTQRYEVDFLPMAMLVALVNFAVWIAQAKGVRRTLLRTALIVCIGCGAIVNIALGISGPYDHMQKNRTDSFLRLSDWFSPITKYRPVLNPAVSVAFKADFVTEPDRYREPLVVIGKRPFRYLLFAEHSEGEVRFISVFDDQTAVSDMQGKDNLQADMRVDYAPKAGEWTVTLKGQEILRLTARSLVMAPSEISVGDDEGEPGMSTGKFQGKIRDVVTSVK